MKKIFIFCFLFSLSLFSQEDKSKRQLFKAYKSVPIENSKIRTFISDNLDKLSKETKDSILISDIEKYKKSIDTITLPDFKKVDYENVPKEKFKDYNVSYDKFKKSAFVTHKKYKHKFYIYLNLNEETSHIRMSSRYLDNNWIFTEKIIFIIDNVNYELDFLSPERDVLNGGSVRESTDQAVMKNQMKILKAICNSKSDMDMRFQGSKGVYDTKLTLKEIQSIKETYELFNSL